MIITTKRPTRILMLDSVITAIAWFAFIYQFTKGIVFLASEHPGIPFTLYGFPDTALNPSLATLFICALVCMLNATLVFAWGRWHTALQRSSMANAISPELSADVLAGHFSLSSKQLDNVRDSRVTVVYHSESGGISHLETGSLTLQQIQIPLEEPALRVA